MTASHPAASAAVTAATTALALAAGRGPAGALAVAAAVLAGQLSVGWANDWLDTASDAGRTDKPTATGVVSPALLRRSAFAALGACVVLSLLSGPWAAAVHLAAVGLGWAYNLRGKHHAWSVLCYAGAFACVPLFVTLGLDPPRLAAPWVVAVAALLGAGAHFTQALPDLPRDADAGVRGAPQRLGAQGSLVAAGTGVGAAIVVAALAGPGLPPVAAITFALVAGGLMGAAVWVGATGRPRLAFPLTLLAAGGVVATALASGAPLLAG